MKTLNAGGLKAAQDVLQILPRGRFTGHRHRLPQPTSERTWERLLEIARKGTRGGWSKFAVERSAAEFLLQLFVKRIGNSCNLLESYSGVFFCLRKPEQVHGGEQRVAR